MQKIAGMGVQEDSGYKSADHEFRSKHDYAQTKYDLTEKWLKPFIRSGTTLANIGCGSGEFNHQAVRMGCQVIACEPEKRAFEMALRNQPKHNCTITNGGLLEFADTINGPLDFIVMHDVLEHIEDDQGAVSRIASLLKPGGVAIISVPALQWLFGNHDVQLGHYRRYSKATLLPLFKKDFKVVRSRYFAFTMIPVVLYFSRLKKKGYPTAQANRGLISMILKLIYKIESILPLPLGTSLLIQVVKKTPVS